MWSLPRIPSGLPSIKTEKLSLRIYPVGTPGGVFAYLRAWKPLLPRVIRAKSCGRALPQKPTFRDIFSLFGEFSLNHVVEGGFDHVIPLSCRHCLAPRIAWLLPVIRNHTQSAKVEITLLCCYNGDIDWQTSRRAICLFCSQASDAPDFLQTNVGAASNGRPLVIGRRDRGPSGHRTRERIPVGSETQHAWPQSGAALEVPQGRSGRVGSLRRC